MKSKSQDQQQDNSCFKLTVALSQSQTLVAELRQRVETLTKLKDRANSSLAKERELNSRLAFLLKLVTRVGGVVIAALVALLGFTLTK